MAKRELLYRGHTVEELQKKPIEDISRLLTSRARRTMRRGFDEQQVKLLERVAKARREGQKKPLRTHCRDMVILPDMVGLRFAVYNGRDFVDVEVTGEMIGKYLGEFALNRKPIKHGSPGVGATRSSMFVPIK